MIRVLMLSRDRAGLDPTSRTAERWRRLAACGIAIDVLVLSGDTTTWKDADLEVMGTGGGRLMRVWRMYRLAIQRITDADLVTAQDPFELGWIACRAAKRAGKRCEVQDHGGFFDGEPADEPFWAIRSRLAWKTARRAHAIRTVSPKSLERLRSTGLGTKTYFLPIAADARFARIDRVPEPGLIVSVGRLVSVKRFGLLLDAFAKLKKRREDAKLIIAGDGPLKRALLQKASGLGIAGAVQFVGEVDPSPYLARAAVFALVSSHEGWGVAAVEAAMAGVPVVMTDTGCARWLSERGRAAVVSSSSVAEIARGLEAGFEMRIPNGGLEDVLTQEASADGLVRAWISLASAGPRTLICAQALDPRDPLFGFFVPWVRTFASHAQTIVCALRVSDPPPELPAGTKVIPLRRAGSHSRFEVLWTLIRTSWRERDAYDSVFVRGDAQYVVLCGWLWRLLGKKVVLWYAHYTSKTPWLTAANWFAHHVVTSVPEACAFRSAIPIGQAVQESDFPPVTRVPSRPYRAIVFGRVSSAKRIREIIAAYREAGVASQMHLDIVGKSIEPAYGEEIRAHVASTEGCAWVDQDVPFTDVPRLLSGYDVLLNATSGSLDKVIVEGVFAGLLPIASTHAVAALLPEDRSVLYAPDHRAMVSAIQTVAGLDPQTLRSIAGQIRQKAVAAHSMDSQVRRLYSLLV